MARTDQFRRNWYWNWREHAALFNRLCKNEDQHTRIGQILLILLLVGPTISPSNFLISREQHGEAELKATRWMDHYILWLAIGLTIVLWPVGHVSNISDLPLWSVCLIVFIVAFRIFDSVSYRLYYVFFKSAWKPWRDSRRSLSIAFANVYEAVVAYGILYLMSGEVCDGGGNKLSGGVTAAYYSFVTITTLGYGDYAPSGWLSRILVILELLTGMTFLVVIIPSLVSLIHESGEISAGANPVAHVEKQIRERAYELYGLRGRTDGHALEDWREAEAEIFGLNKEGWFRKCLKFMRRSWKKLRGHGYD